MSDRLGRVSSCPDCDSRWADGRLWHKPECPSRERVMESDQSGRVQSDEWVNCPEEPTPRCPNNFHCNQGCYKVWLATQGPEDHESAPARVQPTGESS